MKFYRTPPVAASDEWEKYEWKVYKLKVEEWKKVYE